MIILRDIISLFIVASFTCNFAEKNTKEGSLRSGFYCYFKMAPLKNNLNDLELKSPSLKLQLTSVSSNVDKVIRFTTIEEISQSFPKYRISIKKNPNSYPHLSLLWRETCKPRRTFPPLLNVKQRTRDWVHYAPPNS